MCFLKMHWRQVMFVDSFIHLPYLDQDHLFGYILRNRTDKLIKILQLDAKRITAGEGRIMSVTQ